MSSEIYNDGHEICPLTVTTFDDGGMLIARVNVGAVSLESNEFAAIAKALGYKQTTTKVTIWMKQNTQNGQGVWQSGLSSITPSGSSI
jgi:hypothetical protein